MKTQLACFDLDGTLFDTIPANYRAYKAALNKYGFDITEQYYRDNCNGGYYKDFLPVLIGSDKELMEAIHDEKVKNYYSYFDYVRCNEALFSLISAIKSDYYIALVSSAVKENAYYVLDKFGKRNEFDYILTQQDIPKKKPDPCGYLMAMEHFNIGPERTIIFEDAKDGIAAAKASGATYYIVRDIK